MGWPPAAAWQADPAEVELAWRGHSDELEEFERVLAFWTKGVQLPSRHEREAAASVTTADKFRARFRAHNQAFKATKSPKRDKTPDER
jgi:hypothetical protein